MLTIGFGYNMRGVSEGAFDVAVVHGEARGEVVLDGTMGRG